MFRMSKEELDNRIEKMDDALRDEIRGSYYDAPSKENPVFSRYLGRLAYLVGRYPKFDYPKDFFEKPVREQEKFIKDTVPDGAHRILDRGDEYFFEKSFEEQEAAISEIIDNYPDLSDITKKLSKEYGVPLDHAKKYIEGKFFQKWCHDEYHLPLEFVSKYGFWGSFCSDGELYCSFKDKTLLDSKEGLNLAMRLCNFAGQKALDSDNFHYLFLSCIPSFIYYTTQHINEIGFDAPIIAPEVFRSKPFIARLKEESDKDYIKRWIRFLESKTIREWIIKEKEVADKEGVLFTIKLLQRDLKEIFQKYPWPEMEKFIHGFDEKIYIEQIEENKKLLKQKVTGTVDGIFVDVIGSLLRGLDGVNKELYKSMIEWQNAGEKVTIFTDGDIAWAKENLQKGGVDICRFPIESKQKYRGFLFTGYIIDDSAPHSQGFIMENNENYLYPTDPKIYVGGDIFNKMLAEIKSNQSIEEENSLQDIKVAGYSLQHKILDPAIVVSKVEPIAKARHYSLLPKILESDINISGNNNKQHE